MNKLSKYFFAGISGSVSDELLNAVISKIDRIAIFIDTDTEKLSSLYTHIIRNRHLRFFFILTPSANIKNSSGEIGRFFFMENYIQDADSPLMGKYRTSVPDIDTRLADWCRNQEMPSPHYCELSDTSSKTYGSLQLAPSIHENFFVEIRDMILRMEWIPSPVIFPVKSIADANLLSTSLAGLEKSVAERNPSGYKLLEQMSTMEQEIIKLKTVIKYQQTEIANQQLYLQLKHGKMPSSTDLSPQDNFYLLEIARLKTEIEWYKRTYEQRSVLGVIKEKLVYGKRK